MITGLDQTAASLLPVITNKKAEQLIIASSFGTMITQPYGCTIRNIVLAIYAENVDEIYIIREKTVENMQ